MKFSIIDDSINTLKNIKNRGIPLGARNNRRCVKTTNSYG
ncbi:baseplate tail tube cap [Klebsiella phage CPRSB]|nr:baseplate tail tube cap [Klebsiella phage CPRSB]